MKKIRILAAVLLCCIIPSFSAVALADAETSEAPDALVGKAGELSYSFSTPEISNEDGVDRYTTTLRLMNLPDFYGYQIQVKAADEAAVQIENAIGGFASESVYKDGGMNLASMQLDGKKGDVTLCKITIQFPRGQKDRELVVQSLQVVTDMASEQSIRVGDAQNPAIVFPLSGGFPYVWAAIAGGVVILAVCGGVLLFQRQKKKAARAAAAAAGPGTKES